MPGPLMFFYGLFCTLFAAGFFVFNWRSIKDIMSGKRVNKNDPNDMAGAMLMMCIAITPIVGAIGLCVLIGSFFQ